MSTTKALAWARAHGLSPVPLEPCILGVQRSGKRPTDSGWLERTYKDEDFPEGCNVGIHTGRPLPQGGFLFVVDVDGEEGQESWSTFCEDEGISNVPTLHVRSGSGTGYHLYFRTTEPFRDTKGPSKVDFKGLGGQVVAAWSAHHSGGTYKDRGGDIAWAPTELENVLRAAAGGGKERVLTDEQVFSEQEIVLGPELLESWVRKFPYHAMSEVFRRMLKGEAFSSPGHRHQDIRLGILPQVLAMLGSNIQFESLAWAFRGDYPNGFSSEDRARMYDALRTAARKVDPQERADMAACAGMLEKAAARVAAAHTAVRQEIAQALEVEESPDPEDAQQAGLLAGALGLEVAKGRIKNDAANVIKILRAYFRTRLRVNLRTGAYEARGLPWESVPGWRALDEKPDSASFVEYFHTRWGVSVAMPALDMVLAVAQENKYDPVVTYLRSVQWDGQARALDLFVRAVGAEDTDHTRAVTRCFLVGAVARALQPGCKLDTQLILSGPQGARKSTFFRSLCADPLWFSDTGRTFGEAEKDFLARLHTLWIWEDSELQASTRDEAAKKAFLSKCDDTFRPPFARLNVRSDRRFVCAGSTNEDEILYDPTGSRRYHVLTVRGKIDIEYVVSVRDQIWAEAVAMHDAGIKWWLTDEEQEVGNKANEKYRAESPAEAAANKIQAWFERKRALAAVDSAGEEYGTSRIAPAQFATSGQLWVASFTQISDALHLTPTMVGKAASILCRQGWEKISEVRLLGSRMRTSLMYPDHDRLRALREKDLELKNQKKQN